MHKVHYELDENKFSTTVCPFGMGCGVHTIGCCGCQYYGGQLDKNTIKCHYIKTEILPLEENKINDGLMWRKCHAGYKFPSDAIVIPDDDRTTDRDPRLVRCAVWDSKYILINELKKLPVDNG